MNKLKAWPIALAVGLITALFWAVYSATTNHVPSTGWLYLPVSLSRWVDVPAVTLLVATFVFVIQLLFRHVMRREQALYGFLATVSCYCAQVIKTGWVINDPMLFATTTIFVVAAVLSVVLKFKDSGPACLWSMLFISLMVGVIAGFINGLSIFYLGSVAGIIGLAVGSLIRLGVTCIVKRIFDHSHNHNHQAS